MFLQRFPRAHPHRNSFQLIQEITYLEPAKTRASGLTEAEVRHIASVSEKHMKTMVRTYI